MSRVGSGCGWKKGRGSVAVVVARTASGDDSFSASVADTGGGTAISDRGGWASVSLVWNWSGSVAVLF